MTFNVLIATIGRSTLHTMLESLLPQLLEKDVLTIVFDGVHPIELDLSSAKCTVHIFEESVALGFNGHAIRNKYQTILDKTDFILHADDDDVYADDAFLFLRQMCTDIDTLYVAKMHLHAIQKTVPAGKYIAIDNIGTPCGIIPYLLNTKGHWSLPGAGGDGRFYEEIAKHAKNIVFLDKIIYHVYPAPGR
jgi:hypothetical protein